MAQKTTTDHVEIRKWIEAHNGVPTVIEDTEDGKGAGLLRVHFPKASDDGQFKEIGWDKFFDTFDKKDLAFIYQDDKESTFHKFIDRNNK
jgi:hypothetical protein